jgi:hypothetical protein
MAGILLVAIITDASRIRELPRTISAVFLYGKKTTHTDIVRHLSLHIKYSVSFEWQAQVPIAG